MTGYQNLSAKTNLWLKFEAIHTFASFYQFAAQNKNIWKKFDVAATY
jgi:hypothetical protein